MKNCKRCGRQTRTAGELEHTSGAHNEIVRVVVQHDGYGCDTGCCGHSVIGYDHEGIRVHSQFEFEHPYGGDYGEFARNLSHSVLGVDAEVDFSKVFDD